MSNYICTHCNFRFSAKRASECPYCGKEEIEVEKSAEEILDDIGGLLID